MTLYTVCSPTPAVPLAKGNWSGNEDKPKKKRGRKSHGGGPTTLSTISRRPLENHDFSREKHWKIVIEIPVGHAKKLLLTRSHHVPPVLESSLSIKFMISPNLNHELSADVPPLRGHAGCRRRSDKKSIEKQKKLCFWPISTKSIEQPILKSINVDRYRQNQ